MVLLTPFLAIVLAGGTPAGLPSPKPVQAYLLLAAWEDKPAYDARAERELLEMANQSRKEAGAAPFHVDAGLTRAAREHASAMAERQELSHQFPGEPELSQRLAARSSLYLMEAAENVGYADNAERVHDGFMHSVHHRENLLHPSYNVVGIGVVRRGDLLYIVQDFGYSSEKVSAEDSEKKIAEGVEFLRAKAGLSVLPRHQNVVAHQEACSMAAADSLKVPQSSLTVQARHILRYTTLQPGSLPDAAGQAAADNTLKSFTVGSCFARSKSYPNGIYWIVLVFY